MGLNLDDLRAQLTTDFDQADAGITTFARLAGSYYRALIEGGMPAELAATVVRDWHRMQIRKVLWPEIAPFGDGSE